MIDFTTTTERTAAAVLGVREELPELLRELSAAWADPAAWDGVTRAGGIELPAEVCGVIALDEVLPIVTPSEDPAQAAAEREGMFGPPLPVPDGATTWERVLALSGRDPGWRARTTAAP